MNYQVEFLGADGQVVGTTELPASNRETARIFVGQIFGAKLAPKGAQSFRITEEDDDRGA